MMWIQVTCETCKEKFHIRAARAYNDGVIPVNCSKCREALGHNTAVKWEAVKRNEEK